MGTESFSDVTLSFDLFTPNLLSEGTGGTDSGMGGTRGSGATDSNNAATVSGGICCADTGEWSDWMADPPECDDFCGGCNTQTLTRVCTSEANGCPCTWVGVAGFQESCFWQNHAGCTFLAITSTKQNIQILIIKTERVVTISSTYASARYSCTSCHRLLSVFLLIALSLAIFCNWRITKGAWRNDEKNNPMKKWRG